LTSEELLKSGGLFKTRITLMDAFIADPKAPTPEEQSAAEMMKQGSGESHFIELRELSSAELLEIQGLEGKAGRAHGEDSRRSIVDIRSRRPTEKDLPRMW
jgi:hypothetical protein